MTISENLIPLIVLALVFTFGDTRNIIKLTRTRCIVHDPKAIVNASCHSSVINRTTSWGQVYLFAPEPLDNIFFHFKLFKKTDVKYRPFLVDINEDFCAFFKNNKGSSYMKLIYQMYRPYSNLNHSCPYQGDLIFKDARIDPNLLPALWPLGEYRLDFVVYTNFNHKLVTLEFTAEVLEIRDG